MLNFGEKNTSSTYELIMREYKEHKMRIFTRSIGLRMTSMNAYAFASIPIYEYLRQKYGVNLEL